MMILRPALYAPACVLLAAACSSSSAGSSPDAATGHDGSSPNDASTMDGPDCSSRPTAGTIPADVEVVLQDKCQNCHGNPTTDHAPFSLVTYADTNAIDMLPGFDGQAVWQVMGQVIQPNGSPHMPFGDAPALTTSEFATLNGWLQSCALPGTGAGEAGTDGSSDAGAEGNVLISDQYNNRVIEVTRAGAIVWKFGDGSAVPGSTSVVAPNDAERLPNGQTLITGTGTGAGTEPACPADAGKNGCPDNRVIIVDDATGAIVWQYGANGGVSGSGPDKLSAPVASVLVPTSSGAHVLITDQGNNRIIEVDQTSKDIVWTYPPAADASKAQMLDGPNSAERLANGNTLITDEGGNRVIEVTTVGTIAWQYPATVNPKLLSGPAFASRLPNGNTLITDGNNNRVLEVDAATPPNVVLDYSTAMRNPNMPDPIPTRAVRLANGDTLISDQFNDQVIEIDSSSGHNIVYSYGMLGVAGVGANQLNGPYDAKGIGDFTGLTPPM